MATEKIKMKTIAIVGNPNVGKSVMFNNLTGTYVTVSNYPGTSVEVTRGTTKIHDQHFDVVDTPGMYSLLSVTEEERVARQILIDEHPDIVLHMIDAKNLERMLTFTVQLIEAGFNTILVLNMMDELEKLGKTIKIEQLQHELHIPVVPVVATTGRGLDTLKEKILEHVESGHKKTKV